MWRRSGGEPRGHWECDEPILWYEGAGTSDKRWLHADVRGSIIAVTNAAGALIAANRYDEHGIPDSLNIGRFGYTGQAWLGEIVETATVLRFA